MPKTRRWRRGATEAEAADSAPAPTGPDPVEAAIAPTTTVTAPPATEPSEPTDPAEDDDEPPFSLRNLTPVLLLRAAHPRQAIVTALAMAVAGALQGRALRELVLILATVLVGQAILGWFNELVDRKKDARHDAPGKPVADGRLDPGTVWFVLAVGVFVVVPLSVANGVIAGSSYLISLAIGLVGQWVWLRKRFFSWVPWAAAFALYPAFLSYGGWGGQYRGDPPEILVTVLAALLGIGVHFLRALWGLVPDNAEGWTYLPLKLGLRIGASRLLWVSTIYTVLVIVGLAFAGTYVGLTQASS
jgi:4-hydroxybenzoate polyprenyltransferase